MAKLAASEAATAISHQVSSLPGSDVLPGQGPRGCVAPCVPAAPPPAGPFVRLILPPSFPTVGRGGLLPPEPLLSTIGHSDPRWHGLRDRDAS